MKLQDEEYMTDVYEKFWDRHDVVGVFDREMPHTTTHGFDFEYKLWVFMEALTLLNVQFCI